MLYQMYELRHALLTPARISAELTRITCQHPWNPLSETRAGRTAAANATMLIRMARRWGKPDFWLQETMINGEKIEITEENIAEKPFCSLLHFKRETKRKDPKVLIAAPMSGHFATLLRGTVEALLPHHDVYITDWHDARQVSRHEGLFNLDSYIAYIREFLQIIGPGTHVIAVCQPAVPVFAATALMEAENNPAHPKSIILMGGPIDTRISKTKVTELAENKPLSWFENTVVSEIPFYHPGGLRKVYPGFLQLSGFMSMNLDRHINSYMEFYNHLIEGDGESAERHRKFYNEYLSVMDITAEFYLQTVDIVFQKHSLPKGEMKWRNPETDKLCNVDPGKIKKTALMTIEGELDDISSHGQTTAAHDLCKNLPANRQYHHFQMGAGHYGIFNGSRWRDQIMPRIRHFIRALEKDATAIPAADLKTRPDLKPDQWDKNIHGIDAVRKRLKEKEKKTS